jgi:hypothetical protein
MALDVGHPLGYAIELLGGVERGGASITKKARKEIQPPNRGDHESGDNYWCQHYVGEALCPAGG